MKKLLISLIVLALPAVMHAKGGVDSLYFDARGAYHQEIKDGDFTSSLRADYLNLHIFGTMTDELSYRIRQKLNFTPMAQDPFRSTDWMCLFWKPNDKLTFAVGKQAVLIGGYEYDSAPIDVYFYSKFCNEVPQGFAFAVNTDYQIADGHVLSFQLGNSPLCYGFQDQFSYNFAWKGHILPWWKTIWSANIIEDVDDRFIGYLALGNHLLLGNVALDLDVIHRSGFTQKNPLTDYTLITKLIWSVGKWNICGKVGYENNSSENVDENGIPYDSVITPGTEYLYGGCGIEYFPYGDNKLRLHAIYFRDNSEHKNNLQVGVTWRFDVISK